MGVFALIFLKDVKVNADDLEDDVLDGDIMPFCDHNHRRNCRPARNDRGQNKPCRRPLECNKGTNPPLKPHNDNLNDDRDGDDDDDIYKYSTSAEGKIVVREAYSIEY